MLEKPRIHATQGSQTSYNKLDSSAHTDKHCTGWISQGKFESVKGNTFLMLCKLVSNSAMAMMVEWDSYRYLDEHLAKHWKKNGLWDKREKLVGIRPLSSWPHSPAWWWCLSRKSICWTKCLQLGGKLLLHS